MMMMNSLNKKRHMESEMDPMENANVTERLDKQSGKLSNAFDGMKTQISGEGECKRKNGMCCKNDCPCGDKNQCEEGFCCGQNNEEDEDLKKRRESDVRSKEI
ncbi:hypothetical protein CRE_09421 [Caenorhabditis remanei]|uniref:Uncharacterized protein n=1 Tax=Caenorhabditis remanei TaxID=31234 RepID=E3LIR7_CAERE|nr:hypothetical protein CRE_09421 [Caenorhabditis remanei]